MTPSAQKLSNAISELSLYDVVPPESAPVYLEHDNTFFELVDPSTGERVTLGDLLAIVLEAIK